MGSPYCSRNPDCQSLLQLQADTCSVAGFLKDSESLGSYKVSPRTLLELTAKTRGGR